MSKVTEAYIKPKKYNYAKDHPRPLLEKRRECSFYNAAIGVSSSSSRKSCFKKATTSPMGRPITL